MGVRVGEGLGRGFGGGGGAGETFWGDQKGDGSDPSCKIPPFCKDTQPFGEAWPGGR